MSEYLGAVGLLAFLIVVSGLAWRVFQRRWALVVGFLSLCWLVSLILTVLAHHGVGGVNLWAARVGLVGVPGVLIALPFLLVRWVQRRSPEGPTPKA